MKLYKINDTEKFLNLVDCSSGEVTLLLPNDRSCDLKTDSTARQLLKVARPKSEGLNIRLSDPRDITAFFTFMINQAS